MEDDEGTRENYDKGRRIMVINRMYLVHKTSGEKVLLAVHYSTSMWYMNYETFDRYDEFFLKTSDTSTWGNIDYYLEFEQNENN